MAELPILYTGEMVRQIYAGRKGQTRRVVKPLPPSVEVVHERCGVGFGIYRHEGHEKWRPHGPVEAVRRLMGREPVWRCPYGQPGDLLWVRETFAIDDYRYLTGPLPKEQPADVFRVGVDDRELGSPLYYRADGECCEQIPECQCRMDGRGRFWRPSIHMPRWASRLTLRVTDVRVERVQEIDLEGIRSEGVELPERPEGFIITEHWIECRRRWRDLWDSINGKREGCSWEANPWVWVVCFERVET